MTNCAIRQTRTARQVTQQSRLETQTQDSIRAPGASTDGIADGGDGPDSGSTTPDSDGTAPGTSGPPTGGGGPTTPPPAAFADGFGDLGLASLYAGTPGTVTVTAEATTTISDGAVTDTFQEMTDAFPMSEDLFFGDVTELFTDPFGRDTGILPGGVGPRRFGPTTNSYFASSNFETSGPFGATDPLVESARRANGGLSYLLGTPAITLGRERILVLQRRDSTRSDINGDFAFRALPSGDGLFRAIRVQPGIADDTDPFNDPGDFSDFFSNVFASGSVDPMLAYGLSFGDHLPDSSREADNFLLLEAVDAVQMDFPPLPGVASSPAVQTFIGSTDPAFVFSETIVVDSGVSADEVFRVTIPDDASSQRLVFAAGDIDGLVQTTSTGDPTDPFSFALVFDPGVVTVDRFQVAAGVQTWFGTPGATGALSVPDPDAATRSATTRSFLRAETFTELAAPGALDPAEITDRGIWVANPAAPLVDTAAVAATLPGNAAPGGGNPVLLHADFGLATVEGRQVSSISATIGDIAFRAFVEDTHGQLDTNNEPLGNVSTDAVIAARTVASSFGGGAQASTLVISDWQSTAAGGGNPNLDLDGVGGADPGRLGFFVVENAGTAFDDIAATDPVDLPGGVERPMGNGPSSDPDQAFGALRIGVAQSGGAIPDRQPGRFGSGLHGYAAGLMEVENGAAAQVGMMTFARAADGPNLVIDAPDPAANTIGGSLRLGGTDLGFGGSATILGRTVAQGAFVDDLTWGMVSNVSGTQMAMISAEPVARELRGQFQTSDGAEVPVPGRDAVGKLGAGIDDAYDYVQWGFFFGDALATDGARQHAHLGTFAAGSPIPQAVLDTASGHATYTGHAIGNVYNGGAVYTAIGTFADSFDFDRRQGTTSMDFDGRAYGGTSQLSGGVYAASIAGGDRTGTLDGRFVGGMRDGQPNALAGGFEIQNASGDPAAAYRATGTFAGER